MRRHRPPATLLISVVELATALHLGKPTVLLAGAARAASVEVDD